MPQTTSLILFALVAVIFSQPTAYSCPYLSYPGRYNQLNGSFACTSTSGCQYCAGSFSADCIATTETCSGYSITDPNMCDCPTIDLSTSSQTDNIVSLQYTSQKGNIATAVYVYYKISGPYSFKAYFQDPQYSLRLFVKQTTSSPNSCPSSSTPMPTGVVYTSSTSYVEATLPAGSWTIAVEATNTGVPPKFAGFSPTLYVETCKYKCGPPCNSHCDISKEYCSAIYKCADCVQDSNITINTYECCPNGRTYDFFSCRRIDAATTNLVSLAALFLSLVGMVVFH
eukprot:TRINITY_DN8626_c0_g1_i1.p1 TRINITY_DN8626_c0_g1~~TRINITY_DN8626_c0_g1_i1.p1  ORF type:complete len:284 (-),score=24.06 TRINITY_DN8626_c0_g1_i1:578-1429(-)